jgi:hypothetical protein
MQPKTKAIIIIVGAIVVFGLLVATIFDLFPERGKDTVVDQTGFQEVELPDRDEGLPENTVFDSSNASDLPIPSLGTSQNTLEREAQDLAEFFIERLGTYSSDAGFAYIDDLLGFMTSSMQVDMDEYKQNQPQRQGFYSVSSDVAGVQTTEFSLARRNAQFEIVLNRTEEFGGAIEQYQQNITIDLEQDNTGQWAVDGVLWGNRQ